MTRFKKLFAVLGATALLALAAPGRVRRQSGTEGYGGSNVVAGLEQGGGSDTGAPVQAAPVVQAAADEGGTFRSPAPTSVCSLRPAVFCLAWASACAG